MVAGAAFAAAPKLRTIGVEEIKPGMKGYGLTVLRGIKPERFDVEVIDVLHNFRPDQDLILIRTPHPTLKHAGGVAGMSGSPIYFDGRMAGAYAYGWPFGKDPIAGVTPIANMLHELRRPLRPETGFLRSPTPKPKKQALRRVRDPFRGEQRRDGLYAIHKLAPATSKVQAERYAPVRTPLMLGGMTDEVADLLAEKLAPFGLSAMQSAPSGAGGASGPEKYEDGGAVAVELLRGDLRATGVGTVTYVDGDRLVGFGHPMLGAGEVRLPTATARILHVMASRRMSFKVSEALRPVGALVHDRQSSIVVDTTQPAPTVPLTVRIKGLKNLPRDTWRAEAASHRALTPSLVLSAAASALGASVNDLTDMMFRVTSTVRIGGRAPIRVVDEGFSQAGVSRAGALVRLRAFDLMEAVYGNPFERAELQGVDLEMEVRFGREVTRILGMAVSSDEVNPGSKVPVVLTLRPYEGEVFQRVVEVDIAPELAGQTVQIRVSPGDRVRIEQPRATSLDDVLKAVQSGFPATSAVVSLKRQSRGMSLSGHLVHNLPGSALDALASANDSGRGSTFVTQHRHVIPMGQVMTGTAKLTLRVREVAR